MLLPVSVKTKVSSVVASTDKLSDEIPVASVIVSVPFSPKPSVPRLPLRSVVFTCDLSVSSLPDVARNVHTSIVPGSMFNPLSSMVRCNFCPGTTMLCDEYIAVGDSC